MKAAKRNLKQEKRARNLSYSRQMKCTSDIKYL
jgi:hypothetical protein